MDVPPQTIEPEGRPHARLACVDAFRGIVMARMLIGVPLLPWVASLPPGWFRDIANRQLHHAAWHGLTWVDFSFAAYVMIMGLGISLSFRPLADGISRRNPYPKILRRTALLFLLGFIYNGGFTHTWPDIRVAGILQRMAVCYFVGAVVYLNTPRHVRYALLPAILVGYWLLMAFVPVPGGIAGDFSFDGNLAAWVDRQFLPGRAFYGSWDPEGILTTLPAIASCLVGMLWGELLLSARRPLDKLLWFFVAGLVAVNLGILWDRVFPVNKSLWTSSYVLITAGIGSIVLGACYWLTDVMSKERLLFPFVVIGRNVLLAFMVTGMIPLHPLAQRLVGGDVAVLLGQLSPLVKAVTETLLVWLLLYWLHRRRIVVKV